MERRWGKEVSCARKATLAFIDFELSPFDKIGILKMAFYSMAAIGLKLHLLKEHCMRKCPA